MGSLARRIAASVRPVPERTGVRQDPAAWLIGLMGGGRTASGVRVTPESALRVTTVWRCVSLLSWLRASLPLKVLRALQPAGTEIYRAHPNYRLLAQAPNGWMTSFGWRQYSGLCLLLYGNEYDALTWKDGVLQEIIPVHPDRVLVYVDGDGYPVYRVTLFPSEQVIWLSRFEIHHVWTVSNNGYTGLSPIEQQREAVGLALGAEEYGARMLGNGGVPAGVLEIPAGMNPDAEAAMRSTWKELHEGSVSNAGKTAVLKGGAKYTPIGMKSVDIQWIEERKLQVEEICRIYGVPPALVQHTSPASSWGTGEIARYMGFLATTINPMLIASEQAMQRDLFTPEEFDQVWPQHNRAGLLATDLLTRYRSYAIGRQWGWLTANNILALEDMNPVGAEGDVLLDPTNMVRIPVDPTALLDAGGNGGGDGETATAEQVAVFLQKALTGGRGAAEGA